MAFAAEVGRPVEPPLPSLQHQEASDLNKSGAAMGASL
jgi:hypothetical protein